MDLVVGSVAALSPLRADLGPIGIDARLRKRTREESDQTRLAFNQTHSCALDRVRQAGCKHDLIAKSLLGTHEEHAVLDCPAVPTQERMLRLALGIKAFEAPLILAPACRKLA